MSKEAIREQTLSETLAEEEEEEEEEDEEPRICAVCGDQANGYHFNALTCEGCKGFFRRAIKRSTQLRCAFLNNCNITKNNRRQCQACRLRKCQDIGMCKEMIMSDEAVEKRRIHIRQRKMVDSSVQLSPQQEETIQELLSAHRKTFDPTFSLFSGFRPIDRNIIPVSEYSQSESEPSCLPNTSASGNHSASDPSTSSCSCSPLSSASFPCGSLEIEENKEGSESRKSGVFTALPHVTDLTTYMIQNIISFSKRILSFGALSMEDQISLLKGATFEMVQIRFNMVFNTKTSIWECGHLTYCIDDAVRAGFQQLLLDPLMRFHHTLRKLGLQEEEYVLMQAISLFSPDRPGVQHHSVIDELHENLALLLKSCIDRKRAGPERHLLYPKVMACLTEMRTMTEEYSKQVLQIQDIQPDDISPLILEVVSKGP
ncbi:nuclear receptor subfamily 1 group I member 2 [Centroberyx gerrardi]|uniref:nuclear receptor subfamily 1 group I member 2 n=1 Tax=Centroberyx gerrardi TaxID=166262 RepID=UPI003AAAC33C